MDKLSSNIYESINDFLDMKGISIQDKEGDIIYIENEEYSIYSTHIDKHFLLRHFSKMLEKGAIELIINDTANESDISYLNKLIN